MNFLPPKLIVGKARDLGRRYTSSDELVPVRDESAERVSQNRRIHVLIEPEAPIEPEALVELEALV